jgi:hypothetical protein
MCFFYGVGMRMEPTHVLSSSSGLVTVTAPDHCDHLVDEKVFATSRSGRFAARCGALVVSAGLAEAPGRPCPLCTPRATPAQRRARRFRCRGRLRGDG